MDGIEIVVSATEWDGGTMDRYRSGESTRLADVKLDPRFVELLDEVGERWCSRPLKELLDYVYSDAEFIKREFGQYLF